MLPVPCRHPRSPRWAITVPVGIRPARLASRHASHPCSAVWINAPRTVYVDDAAPIRSLIRQGGGTAIFAADGTIGLERGNRGRILPL